MGNTKENSTRDELKERIIKSALEAFRVNGIKSITMDDIAALLKISKRTLYEIFVDKETLLKECILYQHRYTQSALEELVAKSSNVLEVILICYKVSIETYPNTNYLFFEEIKKYPRVYELIKQFKRKNNQVVIDFLKSGVDQGIFRDDINFAIIHMLLREQMDLLITSKVISQDFSFLEVYEAIIFTYLRGISTPMGAEKLEEFIKEYRKEKYQGSKIKH